jgi:hypothetical protein
MNAKVSADTPFQTMATAGVQEPGLTLVPVETPLEEVWKEVVV